MSGVKGEVGFAGSVLMTLCCPRFQASCHEPLVFFRSRKPFGRPDVLLTQFSYANWTGNPDDVAAMKAVAEAKLKEIQLQLASYQPKILIPVASFVWFCRSDNFHLNAGVNAMADVFERFYKSSQSASRANGLGLGLYISRSLAEAMNGQLTANSYEGKGSTFTLRLPRV